MADLSVAQATYCCASLAAGCARWYASLSNRKKSISCWFVDAWRPGAAPAGRLIPRIEATVVGEPFRGWEEVGKCLHPWFFTEPPTSNILVGARYPRVADPQLSVLRQGDLAEEGLGYAGTLPRQREQGGPTRSQRFRAMVYPLGARGLGTPPPAGLLACSFSTATFHETQRWPDAGPTAAPY